MKAIAFNKETGIIEWSNSPEDCEVSFGLNKCKCGCGESVTCDYAPGHYMRVHNPMRNPEVAKKRGKELTGKTFEEIMGLEKAAECRHKLSVAGKRIYAADSKTREILEAGRTLGTSPEARAKQSLSAKGKPKLYSRGDKHWTRQNGADISYLREGAIERWKDPNSSYNTEVYRQAVSEGRKRQWQNPESVKRWMKANQCKPNTQEKRLSYILRHTCPHEFKYNGDFRLGVTLGGKVPDFVNINGKKQVIELFGDYWHKQKFTSPTPKPIFNLETGTITFFQKEIATGKTDSQSIENEKIQQYKMLGFDCLIIWEHELDNVTELKEKILEFCK